jgi:hypothetical protein
VAESGRRTPASEISAFKNLLKLRGEPGARDMLTSESISSALRKELDAKGLKGFKRGGKVKKTGVAKVHKGERVLTSKQAKRPAVRRALRKPVARRKR